MKTIRYSIRIKAGWGKLVVFAVAGPLLTLGACSAALPLRDAAISGAATFVEAATTELLDRMFGPAEQ